MQVFYQNYDYLTLKVIHNQFIDQIRDLCLDFDNSNTGTIDFLDKTYNITHLKSPYGINWLVSYEGIAIFNILLPSKNSLFRWNWSISGFSNYKIEVYGAYFLNFDINQISQFFHVLDIIRIDFCIDFVKLTPSEVLNWQPLSITSQFFSGLQNNLSTFYLRQKQKKLNPFYLFRIYDKILDIKRKGKQKQHVNYIISKKPITRIEVEIRKRTIEQFSITPFNFQNIDFIFEIFLKLLQSNFTKLPKELNEETALKKVSKINQEIDIKNLVEYHEAILLKSLSRLKENMTQKLFDFHIKRIFEKINRI